MSELLQFNVSTNSDYLSLGLQNKKHCILTITDLACCELEILKTLLQRAIYVVL